MNRIEDRTGGQDWGTGLGDRTGGQDWGTGLGDRTGVRTLDSE